MENESQPKSKKDAYRAYLVIAFGVTWLMWGVSIALNQSMGYLLPAPGHIIPLIQEGFQNSEHIIYSILFALATFGPLFGAIYAIRIEQGKKGLAGLWKNIVSFKIERSWGLLRSRYDHRHLRLCHPNRSICIWPPAWASLRLLGRSGRIGYHGCWLCEHRACSAQPRTKNNLLRPAG